MTSQRILQLNAASTAVCAIAMIAERAILYPLFGLESPLILDVIAVAFLAYAAAAVALAAAQRPVPRPALMFFAVADGAWVVGSGVILLLFWTNLAPIARILIIAVAAVVDVFAMLQFRAAARPVGHTAAVA